VPAVVVLFGPAAGPFAEPLALEDFSLLRMFALGGVLLGLIALHPCWPRPETGVLSGFGLAWWFFLGFGYTYYSV